MSEQGTATVEMRIVDTFCFKLTMIWSDLDNLDCLYTGRHKYSRSEFVIFDESESNIYGHLAASAVVKRQINGKQTDRWIYYLQTSSEKRFHLMF